jgi:hypothetical protein
MTRQERDRRYNQSDKGHARSQRYKASAKGREHRQRYQKMYSKKYSEYLNEKRRSRRTLLAIKSDTYR